MNEVKLAVAALLVGSLLGVTAAPARAVDVSVRKKLGVPVGVTVTLTSREAQAIGRGERINIPGVPAVFGRPLRGLAAKIKAADQGRGVRVTLTLKVLPKPGVRSKVESL